MTTATSSITITPGTDTCRAGLLHAAQRSLYRWQDLCTELLTTQAGNEGLAPTDQTPTAFLLAEVEELQAALVGALNGAGSYVLVLGSDITAKLDGSDTKVPVPAGHYEVAHFDDAKVDKDDPCVIKLRLIVTQDGGVAPLRFKLNFLDLEAVYFRRGA